jgi:SNF2 family DNA or RNA helicase
VREADVDDDLWNSLGRNIAPGQAVTLDENRLDVPVERLLASRSWLAQTLTIHGCAVDFDPDLLAILQRQNAERHEVSRALVRAADVDEPDGAAQREALRGLEGSRFRRELRAFQQRDLARLLTLSHGANFSVPGAGKTAVAYALYELERMRGRVRRLLVVAPLSAFDSWLEEADRCMEPAPVVRRLELHPPARCEVLLVNYQRLLARYEAIADWVREVPTHVILDEAHRMKRGRTGQWGAACLDLGYLAVRRDILTGTPAPQHPTDFLALLDFLWPTQATRIMPAWATQGNPPPSAMHDVSVRLHPLFVRTRKDELGLPRPRLRVELSEMKPLQAEIYEALRTRMRRAARTGGRDATQIARMGAVVMHLLQAASNPGLLARALGAPDASAITWPPLAVPADSDLADRIRRYGGHESPAKFDKLATMVAANARVGHKTLVWSNFVANLEELTRVLAPYAPAMIHGGVPSSDRLAEMPTRESELRRFRHDDDCMVLLANPAAMSEGVSLHDVCHDAIYVDRTFNAGQYLQSLDRIHRLGLAADQETRITFLVSRTTIDETVDQRIGIKAQRLSDMLADPDLVTMALPDDEAYGEWIDPEDLDALFAHLRVDVDG